MNAEDKRAIAFAALVDAIVEVNPYYLEYLGMLDYERKEYLERPDVGDRFNRAREAAHAFVEADSAAIIAENTFMPAPEALQ
jgi:hypothetical protein